MLLAELVAVSNAVAATRARSEKVRLLADILSRLEPEEAAVAVSFLAGKPRQDRLGAGWATVYGIDVPPADSPSLQLLGVDAALGELASTSGPGSKGRRSAILEARS